MMPKTMCPQRKRTFVSEGTSSSIRSPCGAVLSTKRREGLFGLLAARLGHGLGRRRALVLPVLGVERALAVLGAQRLDHLRQPLVEAPRFARLAPREHVGGDERHRDGR